jgi:hypothetical protein
MRRITSVLVAFSLLLGVNLVSQAGGGNDADKIIDKAIKAHVGDGKDAQKKGYRGKNKGKLTIMGVELDFAQEIVMNKSGKFKEVLELDVAGKKIPITTVFDGKDGWIKGNGKDMKADKAILDELKEVSNLMAISQGVFVKDKSLKLSVIGEAMVNGQAAIGVKISREGKKSIDMYFDKKSGLISKVERIKVDLMNGMEVTEERIILEYQEAGDRRFAKKVEIKVDGKKLLEVEVLEAQFLETVDDAEFARP